MKNPDLAPWVNETRAALTERIKLLIRGANVRDTGSWVHWPDVARACGQEPADYLALWAIETGQDEISRDEHALNCARAIEDAANYYGWANFDSYPLVLTRAEIEARYPDEPETPPAAHGTYESGGVFPHDD